MRAHSEGSLVELNAHRLLRIRDGNGLTVSCDAGEIWITQESDLRDIVLVPGERFTLDRTGLALLHPVTDALVRLSGERGLVGRTRAAGMSDRLAA